MVIRYMVIYNKRILFIAHKCGWNLVFIITFFFSKRELYIFQSSWK